MADPFRRCPSVNAAGMPCWLCYGHRGGIHEVHPSYRGRSREAGASPVWSDVDVMPSCRFCGGVIDKDVEGRWYATHPADEAPWTCPSNALGHVPASLVTNKGR